MSISTTVIVLVSIACNGITQPIFFFFIPINSRIKGLVTLRESMPQTTSIVDPNLSRYREPWRPFIFENEKCASGISNKNRKSTRRRGVKV